MKKLIFDFDGTLVDSMSQWAGKMLNILNIFNVEYPKNIIKTITPLGDKGTAEYFIREFHIPRTTQELIEMMDEYALPQYKNYILPKPTVCKALTELKKQGYSLNVLTASPHKMLDICLKRNGMYDLFENIWSCDDFGMTKADVNIYFNAAECLKTTAENCIFFDDNINAICTAKKSGMTVIGVYDDSSADIAYDIKKISDYYICTFSEILKIL